MCITKIERVLWAEVHLIELKEQDEFFFPTYLCQPLVGTRLCCIDGSWGEKDLFTGQGWFCTTSSYDYMLGAMTIGRCLSHLYT